MSFPRFPFLLVLFLLIPHSLVHAQSASFFHQGVARSAERFESELKSNWKADAKGANAYKDAGELALSAGDPERASKMFASALVTTPNDATSWLGLARAYLDMTAKQSQDRYRFPERASSAAFLAYSRAHNNELKAKALAVLAKALKRRSYWRPALNAYKISLALKEDASVREAYKQLNAEKGFRLTDYKVQSDAKSPRVCGQFSEKLAKGPVDFSPFVTVNGASPQSVTAENHQLCVGGLHHGKRYEVVIRSGLPSEIREPLIKTARLNIYVRDRSPSARFSGRNYVLPSTGQKGIPLTTVNTETVNIEIFRIGDRALAGSVLDGQFAKQISGYDASEIGNRSGAKIYSGELKVRTVLNEEVVTAVPVGDAIDDLEPGLYVMLAEPKEGKSQRWSNKATQWFVVSDLGLTSFKGDKGLHGFVRSLATAEPLANIEVRLIARNNEVLAKTKTDANGYVRFSSALARGKAGLAPAILVAERKGVDYGFLDLTRSAFDLTDRGVGGRFTPGPLDAFLFAERGVYRAGETVHLTALLRDKNGLAVPNIPLTLVIYRPDGVEHKRITWADQGHGGRIHNMSLLPTAMSGTWRVSVYADPKGASIGTTTFLVEDYVPQRLELSLESKQQTLTAGEPAEISVDGRFLYGAPASNLKLEGEVTIFTSKGGLKGYEDYQFGIDDEIVPPVRQPLFDTPRTDAKGLANLKAQLPEPPQTSKLLKSSITVRLREPGGRTISKKLDLDVKPSNPIVGIKPRFKNNQLGEGEEAAFDILALSPDLTPTDLKGLKWELLKVERQYQWYNQNGAWNYEPVTFTSRIANGDIAFSDGQPFSISTPVEFGRYRLEITSEDPNGPTARYNFNAGWYASETANTPDFLDLALNKETFKPGEKAEITLTPRHDGKALIAVINDKLISSTLIDVKAGKNTHTLEVDRNWLPGAYVTVLVYRPMETVQGRAPNRSIGISWLKLDTTEHQLSLDLELPEKIRPNSTLTVPVQLKGLQPGSKANLIVSAVDVGILNLTNYKAPDPTTWYYGQRRLGTEIRDLYGRLIDGTQGVRGQLRFGGDGGLNTSVSPPAQKPVALFSGLVSVDGDGKASVQFNIPPFDGTLRLMAVAWNQTQLGSAKKDLIVRDPIVLSATPPRFLTAGDKGSVHLTLDNVEGPAGEYTLNLTSNDGLSLKDTVQTFELATGTRKNMLLSVEAQAIGKGKIELSLKGPQDFLLERAYDIPVLPATPNVKRYLVSDIAPTNGKLTLTKDIFSEMISDTVKVAVNVGHTASLDIPGLLLALDRYPFGCAEQTTSRALPLLYLSSIAEKSGLAGEKTAKARVQKAIDRLAELQGSNGSFGLWAAGSYDTWLTAYVTDFLSRAKENGFKVRRKVMTNALDRLQNTVNYAADFKSGGEDIAYALYVLSRNGRASIGDLRYYADTKLENFRSSLSTAQLGAALALYGDKARAERAFLASLDKLQKKTEQQPNRSDYGTRLRDGAATLTLASETKMIASSIPTITQLLETMRETGGHTTTQENAWLLLAANALLNKDKDTKLDVNGKNHQGGLQTVLTKSDFGDNAYVITNTSADTLKASINISGASLTPEPAMTKGFQLKRNFYTLTGKKISLQNIKQNERIVVVVTATPDKAMAGEIILKDRIPAGFEIENPRLVQTHSTRGLNWLPKTTATVYTAFRDDRLEAAFKMRYNRRQTKPQAMTIAYIMRAVMPGTYLHPAAFIEDMYRPGRYARTSAENVVITPQAN